MRFFKAEREELYLVHVTHDLATRIEVAQHGRVSRLNRLVNSNRAAGEIVTPPSITLTWYILQYEVVKS